MLFPISVLKSIFLDKSRLYPLLVGWLVIGSYVSSFVYSLVRSFLYFYCAIK